ncbi:MAG: aspartate/glutamate racemase family protein [Janthinobacterium lividum]
MDGPVRIWFQSATEIDPAGPYATALRRHAAKVLQPGTTMEVRGVPPGSWAGQQPSALFGFPAVFLAVLAPAFLANAVRAEREGYDAFVVGTFIEPFLRELRSAVGIPVVSSLEATLLVGCTAAQQIGLVTINEALRCSLQTSIERHRLGARVAMVAALEPALDEAAAVAALAAPAELGAAFRRTARRVVAAGADAVIPAESILATLVTEAGLHEVDGAAVLDAIAIPAALAEMLVVLQRRAGFRTGRRWHTPSPPPDVIDLFIGRLSPTGPPIKAVAPIREGGPA